MTRIALRAIGLALATATAVAAVGAQESNQPRATFFAPLDVPLVSVDVYASDRGGKPMPGLTLEDFEIFEDGKPVSISHFYAAPGVTETGREDVTPGDPAVESAPAQDLYLVIYFDDTNLSRGRRQSAIEHLRGFLTSELPPDLRVMLVRYDGHLNVEQEFTEETDEVVRALEFVRRSGSLTRQLDESRILREMENANNAAAMSGRSSTMMLETAGGSLLQEIGSYVDQTVQRTRTGIANQKRLIRSLSGLSGRKAMLLVSDGVEARPGELLYRAWGEAFGSVPAFRIDSRRAFLMAARNDLGNDFDELARFANGHRVSYYNLSAMDVGRARASSAEARLMDRQGLAIEQGMSEDVTLGHVAGTTGGRTLVNSPALAGQLDEVAVELASYYSLAFKPLHVGDGKYHRLEVKVKRTGVHVRHREGYLDVPVAERITDRTMAAAIHGVTDNPLGIAVATNGEITPRKDGTYLVPVIITVPIGQLVLIPAAREHQGRLSIHLTVRDWRGDLSAPIRREYPVRIPNSALTTALGQSAGFTLRLAVGSGRQRIAVGLRDEIALTESITFLEIEVGDAGGSGGS
ncbi:MAG: VWA domain-containing protein [Thermoanaerobaculales bacterium]